MTEDTTPGTSSAESGWPSSPESTTPDASSSTSTSTTAAADSSPESTSPEPAEVPAAAGDVVRLDGYAETEPARYALVVDTTDTGVLVIDLPGVPREHQLGTSRI